MKKLFSAILASLPLLGGLQARVWTSADGSKTFDGELVSCNDHTITVKRGIRPLTFKLEALSDEDQKWARAEMTRRFQAKAGKKRTADFVASDLGQAMRDLRQLKGDSFQNHALKSTPKYFLLYYTASSRGTCRATAPLLAEAYKKQIANRPNLELIHLSFDPSEYAALDWATSFQQPWPILLREDIDEEVFVEPFFPNGRLSFPSFILIDHTGKEITRGFDQALAATRDTP